MLTEIEGNLLDIEGGGIVAQQVNCQGVMGSGLAKQIRTKWPKVYNEYRDRVNEAREKYPDTYGRYLLGSCHLHLVDSYAGEYGLLVANLFGQEFYGTDHKQTNYGALGEALRRLSAHDYTQIYLPYRLGSDLAGADWAVVSELIEFYIPEVIIVRLPEVNHG